MAVCKVAQERTQRPARAQGCITAFSRRGRRTVRFPAHVPPEGDIIQPFISLAQNKQRRCDCWCVCTMCMHATHTHAATHFLNTRQLGIFRWSIHGNFHPNSYCIIHGPNYPIHNINTSYLPEHFTMYTVLYLHVHICVCAGRYGIQCKYYLHVLVNRFVYGSSHPILVKTL